MPTDQETDPIPIALVGLGWVGVHRHLPVLRGDRNFRLVGVIDPTPGRAKAVADRIGLKLTAEASSLADVSWLHEAAAVSIATSPWSHAPLIDEARAADLHVLTEKPFTVDPADAERLASPGRKSLAVMHNFQFARSATRLWSDMASGRLGAIRSVSATQLSNPRRRLPIWYGQLPLGLFYDESPHLFYLIRRAAPNLELRHVDVVPGQAGESTPELVTARYVSHGPSGDIPVTLSMRFRSPLSEWYLAVYGEEAVGLVDLFRDIYVRLPNDGAHTTRTVLRTSVLATVNHWTAHLGSGVGHVTGRLYYGVDEVFARFAGAVRNGRDPELIGRSDAADVVRLQHQIVSAAQGSLPLGSPLTSAP